MGRAPKCLISAAVVAASWGSTAQAEEAGSLRTGPTDEELLEQSLAETVEIYDERPDKPFDRDTEVRLTGEQLAARGATDLASALALLPDVTVRDAGRGGFNIDIRGARKGAVSVVVDGVAVSDPYYGTFDVSTIPITDIVEIRVATTPQSPIDGPGGPGGVIEVHTRDAYGEQLVLARATAESLPSVGVTGTARVPLSKRFALRVGMSGLTGARDMQLPQDASIGEQRRAATGSARLEYRDAHARVVVDGFLDDRHYVAPPSEQNATATILLVDRETTVRGSAKADYQRGKLQLQAQSWAHQSSRRSRYFRDATLEDQSSFETLLALRTGGMALATHPIGKHARWAASTTVDHSSAEVTNNAGVVRGDATLIETAGNVQYERSTVRVDAAVGAAIPFGLGADAWPEAKLATRWRPDFGPLELIATAARKGRVPSLRERFEPGGNTALGPEHAMVLELRAKLDVKDRFRVEAAPYTRLTTGTVQASPRPEDMGMLVNLGEVTYYGIDTQARVALPATLEVGGSYNYVRTNQPTTEQRLPHHRADAWVQGRPFAGITLLARGRYYHDAIDRMETVPAYALFDLTASMRLSRELLTVLRVDDALDERPETRAGYFTAGRVALLVLQGTWN